MKFKCTIAGFGEPNANGRLYSTELLDRIIEENADRIIPVYIGDDTFPCITNAKGVATGFHKEDNKLQFDINLINLSDTIDKKSICMNGIGNIDEVSSDLSIVSEFLIESFCIIDKNKETMIATITKEDKEIS